MNTSTEYSFATKTGVCLVTQEKITLTRDGIRGEASNLIFGKSISRALVIYTVLGVIALIIGIPSLIDKDYLKGGVLCVLGVFFLWNVIASRNNSAIGVIIRATVHSVEKHPPHHPFTRGYFVVHFMEKGRMDKRLVMLPGSLSGGTREYERACTVMQETGWFSN